MNKNIKRMFFVLTLVTLLATVGAVCAADDTNSTITTDTSVSDVTTVSDTTSDTIAAEPATTSNDNKVDTKTIEKENKNIKTSTKTVEVNNYDELLSTLQNANNDVENDEFIINLNEGIYSVSSRTTLSNNDKKFTINGNNQLIEGASRKRLTLNYSNLTINNISTKFISNTGNLNINNFLGGSITNTGVLTVNYLLNGTLTSTGIINICDDSIFGTNLEIYSDGEININDTNKIAPFLDTYKGNYTLKNMDIDNGKTNFNNLTIINCTINSNSVNYGNLSLINSIVNTTIRNEGTLIISDDSIFGENFSLEGTGNVIINDTKKIFPYLSAYHDSYNLENYTFNKSISNFGNLTLINPVINAQLTNYGNITIINATGSSLINNTGRLPGSNSITDNGYLTAINCTYNNSTVNFASANNLINCNFINTSTVTVRNGTIINCSFINHTSSSNDRNDRVTGALTLTTSTPYSDAVSVINSVFENNTIIMTDSQAGKEFGGAAINSGLFTNLTLNNCTFVNNKVISTSTWHTYSGGAAIYSRNNLTVSDSSFNNNYVESPHGTVTNGSTFYMILECGMGGAILSYPIEGFVNITNNSFTGNNASINGSAIYLVGGYADNKFYITNNTFQDNGASGETIYIRNYRERVSPKYDGNNYLEYINATTDIKDNIYTNNTFLFKSLNLTAPSKVYSGDKITIGLDIELENPQFYDTDILEKSNYTWYVNGENITSKQTQMDVQINNTNYITYVTPSISNQRTRVLAITLTVLNDIIITPENINQYVFEGELIVAANSRLIFQGEFNNIGEIYNNKNEVIFDGSNATFTNTSFHIEANNNTIQNMKINNTDTTSYIITIEGTDNTIINNTLIQYNNNGKTAAIYNNNGNNNKITQNTIKVSGPALSITYEGGATTANTQGILSVGGQNNLITYNNITVDNSTDSEQAQFGTIEAITAPAGTNNNISYNTINCTGARFNYGINTLENVENSTITYNNITVTGYRYTDGIQVGNGATGNIIANNNINLTCLNATPVDEAAISYGIIITSNGGNGADNNTVTENNININGAVNYGIEVYTATNTNINNNNITLNGVKSMGIGYAHSPNSTITGNTILTNGDSTIPLRTVTEEIQPANIGIQIQQDSDNILIQNNTIQTYDIGKEDATINIETSNVTVKDNNLTSTTKTGDNTITTTQPDTIIDNNKAIEQESTTQTTTEDLTIGDNTTLTAQFYDDTYTPVGDGKAIFKVNGKTLRDNNGNVIYADVINGRAELPYVNITQEWTKEDTTIQAVYVGNDNNDPIITEPTTVTVTKPEATITIDAPTEATAGTTITLKARVTDGENNITSGRVAFKLNGKTLKNAEGKALYANVQNGIATITYTIPAKTKAKEYTLTAVFTDTAYDRVEAESKLNVVKA